MLRSPPVVRKAPTPLRSTQLTPQDSLAASQQTHIEELVQKNRTLEHTIKKLQEALQREEDRGKDAVTKIQQQWQVERTQWREGCDTVESCHRNVQLRTSVELEKERLNVLKEQDVTRKEKFSRLLRDVKITMFQKRETELEYRIGELEDELEDLKARMEEDVADLVEQHRDIVQKLKLKCAELVADAESQGEELTAAQKERDLIQVWVFSSYEYTLRPVLIQCIEKIRQTTRRTFTNPDYKRSHSIQTRTDRSSTRRCTNEECGTRTRER